MKRAIDILLSGSILLLLSPLFGAIALAILLDSGSPVFFSQERVGKDFTRFNILKFRTMKVHRNGTRLTVRGDVRVTRAGRFLRASKLDELPQFLNVLLGQMSVVGPRPEVPEFIALYEMRFRNVLMVRPGITDLASIEFRNEEVVLAQSRDPLKTYCDEILPVKLRLAEKYVRTRSLRGDLGIILDTIAVVVFTRALRRACSGRNKRDRGNLRA